MVIQGGSKPMSDEDQLAAAVQIADTTVLRLRAAADHPENR